MHRPILMKFGTEREVLTWPFQYLSFIKFHWVVFEKLNFSFNIRNAAELWVVDTATIDFTKFCTGCYFCSIWLLNFGTHLPNYLGWSKVKYSFIVCYYTLHTGYPNSLIYSHTCFCTCILLFGVLSFMWSFIASFSTVTFVHVW